MAEPVGFCDQCGTLIPRSNSRFCSSCGAELPAPREQASASPIPTPSGRTESLRQEEVDEVRPEELDPKDSTVYNARGLSYSNLGHYERSIEDFDKAIQLDPDDANAYINRGNSYFAQGEYKRAIEDYDKAIQLEPTALRYTNRGNAYGELGQYTKQAADKAEACSLDDIYC